MELTFWKLLPIVIVLSGLVKCVPLTLGWLATRLPLAERWRVYRRPLAPGQLRSEARAALGVVVCDALLVTAFRALSDPWLAPFTWRATALTWTWLFVGFEVWFYVTHRLLHTKWLYPLHAQHHVAQVTDPLTSLSFSFVERLILIGGAFSLMLLAMPVMPVTRAGILLYILTNYSLNVFGHSNTEWLPVGFVKSWVGRLFFTPTFHALHHARYQGHYGLFTPLLDRWLGTAFDDYEQVHAKAREGVGLHRIGERVRPASQDAGALAPTTS